MKKLIAVLFFLSIGIKVTGCWAQYSEYRYSVFAMPFEESDTKCQQFDAKEKFEEQSAIVPGGTIAYNNSAKSTSYNFHSYCSFSSYEKEPSCPPPDEKGSS
ncbi:hypothetical protein [Longitalea arenae]|uniref:hypothetical protein n=1 Tax=Longitalea arenae TaxID=2812558 RepID=UPI0019689495|nr:hypothetical protein [Longitalea arenae]